MQVNGPRVRLRAILVVSIALVAAACSGQPHTDPPPSAVSPAASAVPSAGNAIVTGRAPRGTIVVLEPLGGAVPPIPEGPAVLDQYSRAFVPDLLFARVGQVVEFRNSEDVDHNVRVMRMPAGTTVMDESGSMNQVFKHTFDQAGTFDVQCDVHPGMRATIIVSHTPFAAGTDEGGRFTIHDVPPGRYALKVTMAGKDTTREVEVTAPRTEIPLGGA